MHNYSAVWDNRWGGEIEHCLQKGPFPPEVIVIQISVVIISLLLFQFDHLKLHTNENILYVFCGGGGGSCCFCLQSNLYMRFIYMC